MGYPPVVYGLRSGLFSHTVSLERGEDIGVREFKLFRKEKGLFLN